MSAALTPEVVLQAYRMGVFPMAAQRDDPRLYWFDPEDRGILPLRGFHLSRSLRRRFRAPGLRATLNADFSGVMAGCARRRETWINAEIVRLFMELNAQGHAHSLEVWEGDALAGGVYGLAIGGVFCGESMFSNRRDGSKLALAWLVAHLDACGFVLFDTQYLTDHLASLGGVAIPRATYHARLRQALGVDADILRRPLPAAYEVVQFNTQTS